MADARETTPQDRPEENSAGECSCTIKIRQCGRPSCGDPGGSECCGVLRYPAENTKDNLKVVYDLTVSRGCQVLGGLFAVQPWEGKYKKKRSDGSTFETNTVRAYEIKPMPGCNIEPWDLKDAGGDFVPVGSYKITIWVKVGVRDGELVAICQDSVKVDIFNCEEVGNRYAQEAKKYGKYDRRRMYIEQLLIPVSNRCICEPAMKNLEEETAPPFDDPCFMLCVNKELADGIIDDLGTRGSCLSKAYELYEAVYESHRYFSDVAECENTIRAKAMKKCGKTKFTDGDKDALANCIQEIVDDFAAKEFGQGARLFGPSVKKFLETSEKKAAGEIPMDDP